MWMNSDTEESPLCLPLMSLFCRLIETVLNSFPIGERENPNEVSSHCLLLFSNSIDFYDILIWTLKYVFKSSVSV